MLLMGDAVDAEVTLLRRDVPYHIVGLQVQDELSRIFLSSYSLDGQPASTYNEAAKEARQGSFQRLRPDDQYEHDQ